MKKIFKLMFAVVAGVAALTACTNEPEENVTPGETPDVQKGGIIVKAQFSDNTKAILADGEGIKWEADDNFTAWYVDAEGNYAYALREDATPTVSEDGYTATLAFEKAPAGGKLWLSYGSNTGYDGCSAAKVEFNYNAAQTQPTAGKANKGYMRLVGERIDIVENGEYTAKMEIVGTIMRYIVYSSNGTYAAEKVKSVKLVSVDNPIAGGSSAIAYNFAQFYDTEAGRKWHTTVADQFSDECVIFWDATSKEITTTLSTPFAVEAKDAASSQGNGVYMFVPPVKVGGYKYVVETDVARYTFDASETPTEFKTNTIKNVILNLEHEKATRVEFSSIKGDLQYIGDLNAASAPLSYKGVTEYDGGYWYAQVRETGSAEWVTREEGPNAHFYTGVTFECIDNATGEKADWLQVSYRNDGNTHWFITADPQAEGAPQRSATVTATFPDVDGYVVTEACKTKTVTVTQMAYTSVNRLGFEGGVGDSVISGGGAENFSLGWCVITVNGLKAEKWSTNENNEQELYGSVVIECREGAANGPIVDWLTVEYGKDANGKHNSTHLLATAPANNTGAERKALVCCTYNAPEGYEFEGGAKSYFRQFFVTQPADTGIKVIEFWGGIDAEKTHDATAQLDWDLGYWVINVDGATATDWNGDSRDEQLLYGSAEFKCYDYTNGVRGEEIDWVTVEYKQENGKIIDTHWLADLEENTGAARAAEIVCTFPELEGYSYKNNQRVRTTIIRQAAAETTGGEEGGDDTEEPAVEGYTYNIVKNNGNPSGAIFGMNVGSKNGADFRIENIKFDGKEVTLTEEMAKEVIAKAFKNIDQHPAAGYDHFELATDQIYMHLVSYNGSTLEAGIATTAESQGYITRLTWLNYDGSEGGHFFVFVP